jgi:quercetin dioxygenase-like cupin family protein
MLLSQINPKGNFRPWNKTMLREVQKKHYSSDIGEVLFENNELKLWKITLEPKQRIPFRRHYNTYSCNCLTDGLLISRNANGAVDLIRFERGETFFRECDEEHIHDLENVGNNTVHITIVEEKFQVAEVLI